MVDLHSNKIDLTASTPTAVPTAISSLGLPTPQTLYPEQVSELAEQARYPLSQTLYEIALIAEKALRLVPEEGELPDLLEDILVRVARAPLVPEHAQKLIGK